MKSMQAVLQGSGLALFLTQPLLSCHSPRRFHGSATKLEAAAFDSGPTGVPCQTDRACPSVPTGQPFGLLGDNQNS